MELMVLNESVTSVPMEPVYFKTSNITNPKTGNGQQRQTGRLLQFFCVGVQTYPIIQTKTGFPALILSHMLNAYELKWPLSLTASYEVTYWLNYIFP